MDIKSKNKYRYIIIFIICSYMFGLSKLAVDDVIKNRDYLGSEPYFNSSRFRIELISYANNIEALNTIYKDYSQKSDEYKVTKAELLNSKSLYDSSLRMRNIEIDEKYKKDILEAENDANKDKFNRLTEARAKELEELKKKNTKTLEDFKKEIIAYKNKDYEYIKRAVRETSEIKYFITRGKNNVIDSNAKMDVSDIDLYIKNNALYSIKLPEQSYNNDQNKALGSLNKWLINTFQEGYFIIPKDIKHTSFIYRNYIYYNTVKQRIITEVVIWFVSFIIGLFLLIYLFKKNNEDLTFIEGLTKWYNKVPLDLRILIFIIYSYKIDRYINKTVFFHSPYNLNQIYILTVIAAYIFYFFINVRVVINLKRNKEEFRVELKRSLLFRMSNYIKHSPRAQSTKFKVRGIMILTLLLGVITICLFISLLLDSNDSAGIILLSIVYIFCYMILMLVYIFKSDRYLGMILKGTEEIVIGNLNYTINVKGRGDLSKLAHNINNMKSSFKKALENEIKSEKLKSELITNVSHDLKTPLTSIITYVDLLKKEDLSKEESEGYIEILDRKSQRLKVLIDDLFEAS
ncbi:MAG: sensor histidine kinase [Clostridiaceae bacterium]|nr:sensor histidine kinase [Clostridiaceae bacterium]